MTDSFRVALLQLAASRLGGHDAAFEEALRRIDDAARDEPDLVVLPEATYPAHDLGDPDALARHPWHADREVLDALAGRARHHGVYIAAGLVLREGPGLRNAAVLFAPDGVEVGRATEAAPAGWFGIGSGPVPVNPRAIPAALVAGADLLDPRRAAAIDGGTRLVISTGAPRGWIRGGRSWTPATAVLPARASAAGAWIVSAGRTGQDGDAEVYAGGAGVVAPDGEWVVRAPAAQNGIVLHTLDMEAARPRALAPSIATPSATSHETRVAAVALDPVPSTVELMESVRALVGAAVARGAEIVVLPDLAGADPRAVSKDETLPLIEALTARAAVAIVVGLTERVDGATHKTVVAVEQGRTVGTHRASLLSEAERAAGFVAGETPPSIVTLRGRRVGLLLGEEGLAPSVAAALRTGGAELLAWCGGAQDGPAEVTATARSWEQRLSVVAAGRTGARSGAFVVASGGHLVAATVEDARGVAVAAMDARED